MNKETSFSKHFEIILLFITAGISLLIGVLDISGILDSIEWITQRIPTITLLCVGFIASYLILERRGKIDEIFAELNKLTRSVEVKTFSSSEKAVEYLAEIMRRANKSIDQASIDLKRSKYNPSRKKFENMREKIVELDSVKFRYIASLEPAHADRRMKFAKKYVLDEKVNCFFAGFYAQQNMVKPFNKLPVFSFTIIDNEEVFIRFPYDHGYNTGSIVIRNQYFIEFLIDYFNKLWDRSYKLKTESDYDYISNFKIKNEVP